METGGVPLLVRLNHLIYSMLSGDRNVDSIARLIEALKEYLVLRKEYTKYDAAEKLVRLFSLLAISLIVFTLVVLILFYLSFAAVYCMAPFIGQAWAFAVIAGLFLVILIIVAANRKRWIEKPLVKALAGILLEK